MKILIFLLLFISGCACVTQAQNRFRPSLKAGIATSQVHGDVYSGFNKFGFDGGATLNAKINDKWSAQFEILFVQKGSKFVGNASKGDLRYYLLQLNYVEVPILFQYQHKKFVFEIGLGIGYLISSKEFDENGKVINGIPFNSTETSGSIGINYEIYKNFGINWRYTGSIFQIRKFASGASTVSNPGQRNNVLAFTLTYTFGNATAE